MKATNIPSLLAACPILSAFIVSIVTVAWTHEAIAMPNFPGEIQAHLGLSYAPPCTLCHATPAGGGPIVTQFGQSMLAAGLTPDTAALDQALDTLASKGTDSNHDGRTDIDQLKEGVDPSTGESFAGTPEEKFGCGARVATGRAHSDSAFALLAAALALVLVQRRPRHRR